MIDFNDKRYRIDDLQTKGYTLCQDSQSFCFGVDSVLIAHFAGESIKNGSLVADLGTGNGIIPILLAAINPTYRITGIEIDAHSCELARHNTERNLLTDKINIINSDFKQLDVSMNASFDAVVTNPPYIPLGSGACSPNEKLANARHEVNATLNDVTTASKKLLKDNGRLFMVHRASRTVEILNKLKTAGLEPKRIQFVHSTVKTPAALLLLEAHKYSRENTIVSEPIIIYDESGNYTKQINDIYGR